MDARLTITSGLSATSVWRPAATLLVAVALLAITVVPASAAATDCLVTNADTGQTSTALQPAVDAASPGQRLTVQGICLGTTKIGTDLLITGSKTRRSGTATLSGAGKTRVLVIQKSAKVEIRRVVIRDGKVSHGPYYELLTGGAGIRNHGTLTLRDVVVTGNRAAPGAGILNLGKLVLDGASRISDNDSGSRVGGGIYIHRGRLTMNDTSVVSGNDAAGGGGVWNSATVVMNDASAIVGNSAGTGGGTYNEGTFTMNGSSSIRGNDATSFDGGGVIVESDQEDGTLATFTMNDSSSIRDNTAKGEGGGVSCGQTVTVTLNDAAIIAANRAERGGGVYLLNATLGMSGSSAIRRNRAERGGGIYSAMASDLDGVICGPKRKANVSDNTPDDCRSGKP